MKIAFHALPTDVVGAIRRTGRDAHGSPVERHHATDGTWPCRHGLGPSPAGRDCLILAHRPCAGTNPCAETGPIFLCAEACRRADPTAEVPQILQSPDYPVRGHDARERVVSGTGRVTPTAGIADHTAGRLSRSDVAFVDLRRAQNTCVQCRIRPS